MWIGGDANHRNKNNNQKSPVVGDIPVTRGEAPGSNTMTKTTKKILIAGAAAIIITAGIVGYNYWKDKRDAKKADENKPDGGGSTTTEPSGGGNTGPIYSPPAPVVLDEGTVGPVKKGDKNKRVQRMQQALIDKLGGGQYITSGATGLFGAQTGNALVHAGYDGASVSDAEYNAILQGKTKAQFDAGIKKQEDAKKLDDDLSALAIAKTKKELPMGTTVKTLRTVVGAGVLQGPNGFMSQSVYNKKFGPGNIVGRVAGYTKDGLGIYILDQNGIFDSTGNYYNIAGSGSSSTSANKGLNKTGKNLGYKVGYYISILNEDNKVNIAKA